MTNVTTILGNESGIQYQGVGDASSSTGTYPVIGLIVGQFKGGRTDKPMTITNSNIKTMLGYEPENPYYVTVQDVLNSGIPSVQVLRIGSNDEAITISCEGADDDAYITNEAYDVNGESIFNDTTYFSISINGVLYNANKSLQLTEIQEIQNVLRIDTNNDGFFALKNYTYDNLRIVLSPSTAQKRFSQSFFYYNETGFINEHGDIFFCLAPHEPQ